MKEEKNRRTSEFAQKLIISNIVRRLNPDFK